MSHEELRKKAVELEAELGLRTPTINVEFRDP
jgi:hypothetical protein